MDNSDDLQSGQAWSERSKLCDLGANVGRYIISEYTEFMRRRSIARGRRDTLYVSTSWMNVSIGVDVALHQPERSIFYPEFVAVAH